MLDPAEKVAVAVGVFGNRFNSLWRSVLFHPSEQSFGTVKREDVAAARHGIETISEAAFRAGGLVGERRRRAPQAGIPKGTPFTYFSDCSSTPVSE